MATPMPLRQTLREATSAAHERLHLHAGFAAIQNGTIDLIDYRALLVRLYGFYLPFEAAAGIAVDRSTWLREDLDDVTAGGYAPATIPRCAAMPRFATPARQLGALYVVDGSTLGGRRLARHLEPLLGYLGMRGRRFFLGRGAETSEAWNALLARLASAEGTPAVREEIVEAAVTTFDIFEQWLDGWRTLAQ